MDGTIASAVVLPEADELPDAPPAPPSPPHSLKRRQSSTAEELSKKPRLETTNQQASQGRNTRHREAGRERRLFGSIVEQLARAPTTVGQRRRAEVDKRQLARRRWEAEEEEERDAERVAKRSAQRLVEQQRFEKESYYQPWDTSPDEDARIQAQIAEVRDTIEQEQAEYEAHEEQETRRRRHASEEASRDAEGAHTGKSYNADGPQVPSATNGGTNLSADSPKDLDLKVDHADSHGSEAVRDASAMEHAQRDNVASHGTIADEAAKDSYDDHGEDVVEEAAEDTVIY